MPDIDPRAFLQQLTPRNTSVVDAIAEDRRVLTAIAGANPLINAVIDDGLMRWRGNYGGEFLWIGEFQPDDPALNVPQRAFSLVRDDPLQKSAIAMYDAYTGSRPGGPLIQQLHMHDHWGEPILLESQYGGLGYPRSPIVLYGQVCDVEHNAGDRWIRTSNMGAKSGEERMLYWGLGNMSGSRVHFQAICNSNGPTYQYWLKLLFENGHTHTTSRHISSAFTEMDVTIDFESMPDVRGGWVRVEVWGTNNSADNQNQVTWIFPRECESLARF